MTKEQMDRWAKRTGLVLAVEENGRTHYTPSGALAIQFVLQHQWASNQDLIRQHAKWMLSGDHDLQSASIQRALDGAVKQSQVILWDCSLFRLAIRGCEAFLGSTFRDSLARLAVGRSPHQLWVFDAPVAVPQDMAEFFDLDASCVLQSVLIFGLIGLHAVTPDEAVRLHETEVLSEVAGRGLPPTLGMGSAWFFRPADYDKGPIPLILRVVGPVFEGDPIEEPYHKIVAPLVFMTSEIAEMRNAPHTHSRQQRRHAERKGQPLPDPSTVRTVVLRRAHHEAQEPRGDVEWTCRWIVRGHWRRQWMPAQGIHAPRFIAPHVKGPDDKPIRPPREAVYIVKR